MSIDKSFHPSEPQVPYFLSVMIKIRLIHSFIPSIDVS